MADNTIHIRITESSHISPTPPQSAGQHGRPQSFTAGQPAGAGGFGRPPQAPAKSAAPTLGKRGGAAPSAKGMGGATGALGKFTAALGGASAAAVAFAAAAQAVAGVVKFVMDYRAMQIRHETDIATARIRNQEQEARMIQRKLTGEEWAKGAEKAPLIGGAAADLIRSNMDLNLAQMRRTLEIGKAFRGRTEELSRYDGGLGRVMAFGEVNRQRRDVGEAQILSGHLSEVEARQQQLDKINQQLGILAKMKEAGEQTKRVNEEIRDRQADLDKSLKDLPAEMARKIRELGNDIKDPFDLLEAAGGFAGSGFEMARQENDLAARQHAARLNIPLLQGLE